MSFGDLSPEVCNRVEFATKPTIGDVSTAVPALTYAERRPSEPVRGLLTRNYLGFTQPATEGEHWLATPTPTATVIVNTGAAFGGLPGVSGHLLGGALAAILVGPWVGALCVSIVLAVQALVFADGGLTALGANITNMAFIGLFAGFAIAVVLRRFATRGRYGLAAVAFLAAFVNTVVASLGFVLQFAIGGDPAFSLGGVTATIVSLHALIGIGEGLITALTVTAVATTRPDLVYLLRGTAKPLELRDSPVAAPERSAS